MEQNAFLIWKFNNFKLIYEYRLSELNDITLFPLPPPLNLINAPVFLIKLFLHGRKSNKNRIKLVHEKENQIYESILGKRIILKYQIPKKNISQSHLL